jgi:hypothetical protein
LPGLSSHFNELSDRPTDCNRAKVKFFFQTHNAFISILVRTLSLLPSNFAEAYFNQGLAYLQQRDDNRGLKHITITPLFSPGNKPFIPKNKLPLDLYKTFIDLCKSLIDLYKTSIDLCEIP